MIIIITFNTTHRNSQWCLDPFYFIHTKWNTYVQMLSKSSPLTCLPTRYLYKHLDKNHPNIAPNWHCYDCINRRDRLLSHGMVSYNSFYKYSAQSSPFLFAQTETYCIIFHMFCSQFWYSAQNAKKARRCIESNSYISYDFDTDSEFLS